MFAKKAPGTLQRAIIPKLVRPRTMSPARAERLMREAAPTPIRGGGMAVAGV